MVGIEPLEPLGPPVFYDIVGNVVGVPVSTCAAEGAVDIVHILAVVLQTECLVAVLPLEPVALQAPPASVPFESTGVEGTESLSPGLTPE
jgi:hypothetical protein